MTRKRDAKKDGLSHSLLENAVDFLSKGVEEVWDKSAQPRQLKYGLLHTAIAVELFLKKRLYDGDWSLVFANMESADRRKLHSGNFRSVGSVEAIKRLEEKCGCDLSRHKKTLTDIRLIRNKITHYEVSLNRDKAVSLLVETWSMLQDFVADHIGQEELDGLGGGYEAARSMMVGLQEYCDHRRKKIKVHLEQENNIWIVLPCPECLSEALPLTGDDTECLFCRSKFSKEYLQDEWIIAFVGWDAFRDQKEAAEDRVVRKCPECGSESLCDTRKTLACCGLPDWICFGCAGHWDAAELAGCGYCAELYNHRRHGHQGCPGCLKTRLELDE